VSATLRFPSLLFAAGVERVRRLPGAGRLGPLMQWLPRVLLVVAVVLGVLWAGQVSPQRMRLADLAAGKLGQFQSWIIVSGDLADMQGSTDFLHLYRLTDPAAPNAYLVVRSRPELPLGPTTVSGHIVGGREGVPPGYAWSAPLDADSTLAGELPPPWTAILLGGAAVLIIRGRRSRYPMFVGEKPTDPFPATSALRVNVRSESGRRGGAARSATLSFASDVPGAADLSVAGARPEPVRLHSAFTSVDVGVLHRLGASEPALRVRSEDDDLTLAFASRRERDSAFAALGAEAQRQRAARRVGRASSSGASG
jgi:hypothetical protein